MLKWGGSTWAELETREINKDSTNTYYEAITDSLSSLAIVGKRAGGPVAGGPPEIPETPIPTIAEPATTAEPLSLPTEKATGFGFVLAMAMLFVVYNFGRKRR